MTNEAEKILAELEAETPSPSKTISDLISEALVPQGVEIPKPEIIFGIGDIPMFTKKSLSVLKGQAKAGKTTATAWITANVINQHINVLWIDTEQGLYYASRTQSWILRIAGLERSEHLNMYDLKIHSPTKRIEIIEELISSDMFDLIIVDGIRDLVFDINSPEEATITVNRLMRWADMYDCHVLNIIHQNKGSDHARGHLGTELINKSETVIKISKAEDGTVYCDPEFTRSEPFEPFGFQRDTYGIPVLVTVAKTINTGESNKKKLNPTDLDKKMHTEILIMAMNGEEEISYGDLQSNLSASFGHFGCDMGVNKIKTFIAWYGQNSYIQKTRKTGNKTFYKLVDQK